MTTQIAILSIFMVLQAFLALVIYFYNTKNESNFLFTLFISSSILWTIGNFLADSFLSLFWTNVTYLGAIGMAYFFLCFTETFPTRLFPIKNIVKKIILGLTVVLVVALFAPGGLILSGIELYEDGVNIITGPFFFVVTLYFLITYGSSIILLARKLHRTSGRERTLVKYVTLGLTISVVVGILVNLIIPVIIGNYELSQYSPLALIFLTSFTTVAIVRSNQLP